MLIRPRIPAVHRRSAELYFLIPLFLLFSPGALAEELEDVVVLAASGDPIPGHAGTLLLLENPVINEAGEVKFTASISGGTASNGFFSATPDGLRLLLAEGDPSPDGNGQFDSVAGRIPFVNASGAIAFDHFLVSTLSGLLDAPAILAGGGADEPFTVIVRGDQPVPGSLSDRFSLALFAMDFNDSGDVAFLGTTVEEVDGIWRGDGSAGGPVRIVGTGDPNPTGDGVMTGQFPLVVVMNNSGEVAFVDFVLTPDGTLVGVYRGAGSGSMVKIARQGDPVPSGNGFFRSFEAMSGLAINDLGEVAFLSLLTDTSAGTANNFALFRGSGGTTEELVRKGDPTPDGNGSFLLDLPQSHLTINDRGSVLFYSAVTGASGGAVDGLFLATSEGIEQIVRRNDPAPGGGMFQSFGGIMSLNESDQVAFYAVVEDGFSTVAGLFLYDEGRLVNVAREGDILPGMGVLTKVVTSTGLEGLGRSSRTFFNDFGQVAFTFFAGADAGIAIATPCDAEDQLQLTGLTIFGTESHRACDRIVVSQVRVETGGDLTLRAGGSVVLSSGFSVATGARLTVAID